MTAQSNITPESIVADLRYLQLLSRSFPTIAAASTEIINLEAILNLPKGTEHFLTDIHGEYEAFQHVLKNASGAVKRKVNEIFGHTLREIEKKELCTLIYYPEEKLQLIKATETDIDDWYLITLNQLVKVCQNVSSKYTRSKVRKSLPAEFSYIIQELLHESTIEPNKHAYINVIISTIISTRRADDFIIAMCNLIQRLTIDSLHIVGDIYDRGPGAHIIMDTLCDYHNFDIQWGNHDILWMGAASGNEACMANVIRLSMRYGNLGTLEDGYGINLLPLATFAMDTYADDPCTIFAPKTNFAFDSREDSDYLPHNYHPNCVVYTGTHDNDTLQGWYQALKEEDKEMALEYIGNRFTPEADIHWDYIRLAMRSVADTCIIPVQDYLGLGCEARINTPSTLGGNWIWRSDADSFTDNLAAKIKKITQLCARSLQQKGE